MVNDDELNNLVDDFEVLIERPEKFLDCEEGLKSDIKNGLKRAYDFSKSQEIVLKPSGALPELLVKNFDSEQIWQQLELQNDKLLSNSLKSISKLLVNKDKLVFTNLEKELKEQTEPNAGTDDSDSDDSESDHVEGRKRARESDGDENVTDSDEEIDLRDIGEEEEKGSDDGETDKTTESSGSKSYKKSVVDDEFFKLEEMETFLESEEKKINEPDSGNDSEKSDEESGDDDQGSVDLFKDDPEDEEDNVRKAKFKDFFVAKEDKKPTKRNKFLEEMSDDEEKEQRKSTFELRQERLQKRINSLEQKAVSEKPWTLKGEVKADDRPQNSLLEEVVEFDMTSRPAPVITEKTTLQLEDIIKQRIKDKVFDSVERKAKLVDTPLEYKKKLVLDQEKSKHSLAQIYEKEYLDQQAALDPDNTEKEEEEPESHKEVKKMMRELFRQLDALANFHFSPMPAQPELKVVSNLPAVNMEEVAPVTASDAALLAPEEVRNKARGDILGQAEKTATDKKRERRKKKQKQKHHIQQINKNLLNSGKSNQKHENHFTKEVMKARNVEKMEENLNPKSMKSSKAFFQQLQDQVQTHIGERKQVKKKKEKNQMEAKKLKL